MTSSRQSLHPSSPTPSIPPPSLSLHHSPLPAQVRLQESHFPHQNLKRETREPYRAKRKHKVVLTQLLSMLMLVGAFVDACRCRNRCRCLRRCIRRCRCRCRHYRCHWSWSLLWIVGVFSFCNSNNNRCNASSFNPIAMDEQAACNPKL